MCLIFVRDNSVNQGDLPEENLRRAFNRNPDGCGFIYLEEPSPLFPNGQWHTHKVVGADENDVIRYLHKLNSYYVKWAVHFRLATHGSVNERNCHPFKVGENSWIMHNGVLPYEPTRKDRSDTWQFAQYIRKIGADKIKKVLPILEHATEGSRMLYCLDNGDMLQTGHWTYKPEGDYSNTLCFPYTASTYTYRDAKGVEHIRYIPQSAYDRWGSVFDDERIAYDDEPTVICDTGVKNERQLLKLAANIPESEIAQMSDDEVLDNLQALSDDK